MAGLKSSHDAFDTVLTGKRIGEFRGNRLYRRACIQQYRCLAMRDIATAVSKGKPNANQISYFDLLSLAYSAWPALRVG